MRARAAPVRTDSWDARPPNSSPSASTTIDLPLPVSPVSRLRPRFEAHTHALDDGVVLDHQLEEHPWNYNRNA